MSLLGLLGRGFAEADIPAASEVVAISDSKLESITGCLSTGKSQSAILTARVVNAFRWKFPDANGNLVTALPEDTATEGEELTVYPSRSALFLDVFNRGSGVKVGSITWTIDNGLVVLPPLDVRVTPSIYLFEFYWMQPADYGSGRLSSRGLVSVEESALNINTSDAPVTGPPTMSEIRDALRDFVVDNDILGRQEFSDAEILRCLLRPLAYWNETPPHTQRHSAVGFPYRERWLQATCALLKQTSAEWMLRNQVPIQGEGLSADDRDKWKVQFQLASDQWREYVEFVHAAKRAQNLSLGFRCF